MIIVVVLFALGLFLLVWYYFGDPTFMRSPPWSWLSFGPTAAPGLAILAAAVICMLLLLHNNHKHRCLAGEVWSEESHMCVAICPPMGCV